MRFSEYVKRSKSRPLHEGALKDDSKYVSSNGFVTSDIVKDIKLSDDGDELYNFIMNDENTYNDVVTKTSEHLDNYFKKYGELFNGGINSFKKAVSSEKDSYPYGRLKVKKSDIQAVSIILANDWYESRKKKLNLKENCKKALKESETYDLEFLKDVLAQCSDAQLADIYNMIVVENLNNCSLASIADSFIAGEDQIYEPFKSLFKKNGIKLDAIYMRYSTIIGTELPPIDYERFDEYYDGESIESVLKNDLGTYYDVNVYDYGYDSLFVELEDIAIKNVWQKASGIDNLEFATRLLEDIAEDQGIDVIQNYIEENYRIKSADDVTPDVVKNAIIAVVLRDLGSCLFMLSELVTFTPKALDAIKKFCKDVDDFYEYWR
jgi:hypothetical protein